MAAAAIPLITAVIGMGSTVYASEEQSRQARLARDQQQGAINDQKKALLDRQTLETNNATRDAAKAKQDGLAATAGGRQGTILTSPLGVVNSQSTAPKTLLGT